jgi:chemotaxis receptor (MCP) glutamine deamidase CheD
MTPATNMSHRSSQVRATGGKGDPSNLSRVRIFTGDVAASAEPVVLHTLLGSCVAVCLHDPFLRIGGMNHILLPGERRDCSGTRFGVHAMELLINQLMQLGADRRRLLAKAFGGAHVLHDMKQMPVGDCNAKFVRSFLSTERIPLIAERLGGSVAVQVYFETDSGKATVHSVDGSHLPKIVQVEDSYRRAHHAGESLSGEITLF